MSGRRRYWLLCEQGTGNRGPDRFLPDLVIAPTEKAALKQYRKARPGLHEWEINATYPAGVWMALLRLEPPDAHNDDVLEYRYYLAREVHPIGVYVDA